MIPETATAGEVALWRAVEFPYRWQRGKLLARGLWVDMTPHWQDGRWYFFTARTKPGMETYLEEWIGPDWFPGLRATHTISVGGSIEIRDGSRFRRPGGAE